MKKIILPLLLLITLSSTAQIYIRTQEGDSIKIDLVVDSLWRDGGKGTVTWGYTYGKYDSLKMPLIIAPKYLHNYNYSFDYSNLEFEGRQPAITDTTSGTLYIKNRNFKDEVTTPHPTYTWENAYKSVPIIDIKTYKKIVIENCVFVGAGDFVHARFPNSDVTIKNCVFVGLEPTIKDMPRGTVLYSASGKYVDVQNNYMEQVRGVYVEESKYNTINIRANKVKNIDGRFSNTASRASTRSNEYVVRAPAYFVKLSLVSVTTASIMYNEVINYPGQSAVQDIIYVTKLAAHGYGDEYPNLNIEYNFLYGNWSYPFSDRNENYQGAAIRLTGKGTSASITIYENSVISGKDIRFEVGSGHQVRNNVKMFSHLMPDGSPYVPPIYTFNIVDPFNLKTVGPMNIEANSVYHLNKILVTDRDSASSWDSVALNTTTSYRGNTEGENTTLRDEQDEYARWRYVTTEKGVNIGPTIPKEE